MRVALSLFLTVALSAAPLSAQGARFVTSGVGCPAPTPPTLSLTAAPLLGTTTTLKVSALPLDALLPFALLAGTQTNVPLDLLGATGCTLFVDNVIVSLPMSLTVPPRPCPSRCRPTRRSRAWCWSCRLGRCRRRATRSGSRRQTRGR